MVVARTGRVDAAQAAAASRREGQRGRAVARSDGADVGGGAEPAGDGAELVAAGADVNARSTVNNWQRQVTAEPRAIYRPAGGLTPLLYAAREGCVECARSYLVDAGADINLADPEEDQPAAAGGAERPLRYGAAT